MLDGCKGREPRVVKTLLLHPQDALMRHNIHLDKKYKKIQAELKLVEKHQTEDAELIIVAYGITARVAKGAMEKCRNNGMKVGLIRPITLWPFPYEDIAGAAEKTKKFLAVEMSNGQLIEDVKLSLFGKQGIIAEHFGFGGGWYPSPENIFKKIKEVY